MFSFKKIAMAVGGMAMVAMTMTPSGAEAHSRGYLSLGVPGFYLNLGRPHYRHHYGYSRYYYRPRTHRPRASRCAKWSDRCARNWGYGNRNWRGCMRYYGCR